MTVAPPLRILLVEDDSHMRGEFERMVRAHAHLSLMGSAGSIAEARELLLTGQPDVAIVDLGLPDGDGAELIELLHRSAPETAVLVSTVFGDEAHVIRAIEAGARGYLLKDTSLEDFARSIQVVFDGGSPLSPQVARHLLKRFSPAAPPSKAEPKPGDLTSREVEILTRISQGFSVAESAAQLEISHHTVSTHIKNIYGKLVVHNRVEAVNEARRKGLIR